VITEPKSADPSTDWIHQVFQDRVLEIAGSIPESERGSLIASELEDSLYPEELSGFDLPAGAFGPVKPYLHKHGDAVFELANAVAIAHRQSVSYSNFHTWEHFQRFATAKEAGAAPSPASSTNFRNCLYMANTCASALRSAIGACDKDYTDLVDTVQIATDCMYQTPKSSREYHCIVMLRLPDFCMVMDPVAYPFAIKVPLNGIWAGEYSYDSFRYVGIGPNLVLQVYD
jgi:hypothetical protein